MMNELESLSETPSKQDFAATFRLVSRFSFWIQLALGSVSSIVLLFAMFSRNASTQTSNAGIGFGIFLAIAGILVLCFRIFLAVRYRVLARRLQATPSEKQPKKSDIIKILRLGLIVSLVGLAIAFIASETVVVTVLGKALALPQGVAVYNPENAIRSLDMFVILANVNLVGAHFFGALTSLGLLDWID